MSSVVSVLTLITIVGLIIFGWWYNSPRQKGKRGEKRLHELLLTLPEGYHVFDDVILNTNRGTTQIDHIVVSKYGIFTIETKNYRGEIYGDDERQEWTQIIVTEVRYRRNWYKTYTYVTKNHFYRNTKQTGNCCVKTKSYMEKWKKGMY